MLKKPPRRRKQGLGGSEVWRISPAAPCVDPALASVAAARAINTPAATRMAK